MSVQLFYFSEVNVKPPPGASTVPAFFVESTAPVNFDDKDNPLPTPPNCKPSNLDDIVDALARASDPSLLITVHGYNTPRQSALETYAKSFLAVNQDAAVVNSGVVCVGYRWPSEAAGTPWRCPMRTWSKNLLALVIFLSRLFPASATNFALFNARRD